jgi:AcrR family transcriptional regulator
MEAKVVMDNNVVVDNNDVNGHFVIVTPVESSRPYHHGRLREALLEQALTTVRDRGVDALSLRELARAVGVSHAAPRRHFPDRQALLDALAIEGFARLGAELRRAADGGGDHGVEPMLQRCARAYVAFATDDAALLELMFAGKHADGGDDAALRAFTPMLELILRGQDEGVVERGDPEHVGLLMLSALHGIASLRGAGMIAPEQLDGLVDDAIAHFLRGTRSTVVEGADVA